VALGLGVFALRRGGEAPPPPVPVVAAPVVAPAPPAPAPPPIPWPEGTPAPTGTQHMGPGHGIASNIEEGPVPGRSQTVHRTLRSGAVARFDGDLYVYGDVNPGAHVIATGNITVLGALKGVAHAGAAGDESCFIMAFDLRPTQLRIGRKIAVPPPRPQGAPTVTEQAWVEDGQIVIAPYSGGGTRQPPASRTRS
jgi:septum site-determining protein MinC